MTTTEVFGASLRADFEAWHRGIGIFARYASTGDYACSVVQSQWLAYQAATERAAKQEREECAKLCESLKSNWNYCAAAIRAREDGVAG